MRLTFSLTAIVLLAFGPGCVLEDPDVPVPSDPGGSGAALRYADSVVSFFKGGVVTSCAQAYTVECGTPPVPMTGCAPNAAVGMPDDQAFALSGTENIVLAFRCGASIYNNFRVFAELNGASGIVEISDDLARWYAPTGLLTQSPQNFNIRTTDLRTARYVRVTARGQTLAVDGVEAQ